jgi:hypothetical protein
LRQSLTLFFIPFYDLIGGPRPSVKAGASSASLPRQRLVNLLGPMRQPLWLGEPSVRKVPAVLCFQKIPDFVQILFNSYLLIGNSK